MQTAYKIITKDNGNFGLQRIGGAGVYGDFDTMEEAMEAAGISASADASAVAEASNY